MKPRDKIIAELITFSSRTKKHIYTDLILPATEMQMEDMLQKSRIAGGYCDIIIYTGIKDCPYLPEITKVRVDDVSLNGLNLFAKRLTMLSESDVIALRGIFLNQKAQGKYDDGIPLKDLINLTYGLQEVPVINNISTDEQLGQFVIDNDFNEEIVSMDDSAVEKLDRATVGKQHREAECGEFVEGYYVETALYQFPQEYTEEIEDVFNFDHIVVFELDIDIAKNPVNDSMENTKSVETICLPIPKSEANEIAKAYNGSCIEDCVYYGLESAIEGIDGKVFGGMKNLDKLNDIAKRYLSYSQADRVKFKAVIESEAPKCLDEITDIAENLHRYSLAYYADTAESFAKDYLSHYLPTNFDMDFFFKHTNLTQLGKMLAERLGASFTEYGVISARDKGLYDIIPYNAEEQAQTETEEMGGMQM